MPVFPTFHRPKKRILLRCVPLTRISDHPSYGTGSKGRRWVPGREIVDDKGDADCAEWSELIRDLTALGQRNIVLFLIGQIWSGYPDAVARPSEEAMLPVDSKVALAEIVSKMAEPGNPLSERLLGCFRSARALISKGYPQMGELMMLEGYLTIKQFKAADLPNYNPESKWRAEILVSALQTMTSPTLPRA